MDKFDISNYKRGDKITNDFLKQYWKDYIDKILRGDAEVGPDFTEPILYAWVEIFDHEYGEKTYSNIQELQIDHWSDEKTPFDYENIPLTYQDSCVSSPITVNYGYADDVEITFYHAIPLTEEERNCVKSDFDSWWESEKSGCCADYSTIIKYWTKKGWEAALKLKVE